MSPKTKRNLMWGALIAFFIGISVSQNSGVSEKDYSYFINEVSTKETISSVAISPNGKKLSVMNKNGQKYKVTVPEGEKVAPLLIQKNITVKAETASGFWEMLMGWGPTLLLIGFFIYMMRGGSTGTGGGIQGGDRADKMISKVRNKSTDEVRKVSLDQVKGCDNAKKEVAEIIEYMKNPERFTRLGAKAPRGVLMSGPPGTGKTMLARAIASEANAVFISRSGSSFNEMFVGVGAARVRDMFEEAANAEGPAIIFIDEIDAIGKARGNVNNNEENANTLNELLVQMDGLNSNSNIFVIGATNRPEILDSALCRPGRFDRNVQIDLPDLNGRRDILKDYMKDLTLGLDVNLEDLARGTPGFSGAELSNVCNEAALIAGRENQTLVNRIHFEKAMDKVMMGTERNMVMSYKERSDTAYHEVGHAIVGAVLVKDPVHKISIIPRGRALGVTMQYPEKERYSYNKKYVLNYMAMLLGGRAAEELFTGDVTSGASDDIRRTTEMAKNMVTKWGMSDNIGLVHFDERSNVISEHQMAQINTEVQNVIGDAYEIAKKVLTDYTDLVEEMTAQLLEKETLTRSDIDLLLNKYGVYYPEIASA